MTGAGAGMAGSRRHARVRDLSVTASPARRERRHVNPPAQPPGQALYLNGNPVSVIAADYGGCAAISWLSRLPQQRVRPVHPPPARREARPAGCDTVTALVPGRVAVGEMERYCRQARVTTGGILGSMRREGPDAPEGYQARSGHELRVVREKALAQAGGASWLR